jgi:hypothetical protein
MRTFVFFVLWFLSPCLHAAPVSADALPATLGYTLYTDGVRVGHSGMKITRDKSALRFESKTRVEIGPNVIELTSQTEADPESFVIRRFSFEGTKGGMATAALVVLRGDSATGWVERAGSQERSARSQVARGGFVVFEDWVMDLEVLLALHQAKATEERSTYPLLYASSFSTSELLTGFTGEVAVESATRSIVARKLEFSMTGGSAFESHVDPRTGIPVYLHFPVTRTEAFLDDFFGDKPVSRYSAVGAGSSGR